MAGDGIFFVALPWQVYELSNAPTALAVVGIAWTLPMVLALLAAGVASDRLDRRSVLIAGDILRMAALAAMAALSLSGADRAVAPARPVGVLRRGRGHLPAVLHRDRAAGRAAGGSAARQRPEGAGGAARHPLRGARGGRAHDRGAQRGCGVRARCRHFAASLAALLLISPKPAAVRERESSVRQDLAEAWRYVRAHAWLWVTLASAALSLLASYGPLEVLLPYVIKNDLEEDAATFGFVLGAGGLGAILAAVVVGRGGGLPRRAVTLMFVAWTVATLLTGAFALANSAMQMYAIAFVIFGANAIGMIVWNTLMHTLVPQELLGRVSSLDWFVSIGLIPVSFALTGPIAELAGAQATLIGAGRAGRARHDRAVPRRARRAGPRARAHCARFRLTGRPAAWEVGVGQGDQGRYGHSRQGCRGFVYRVHLRDERGGRTCRPAFRDHGIAGAGGRHGALLDHRRRRPCHLRDRGGRP